MCMCVQWLRRLRYLNTDLLFGSLRVSGAMTHQDPNIPSTMGGGGRWHFMQIFCVQISDCQFACSCR